MRLTKLLLLILLLVSFYCSSKMPDEISFLIEQVRNSNCTFIRNGIGHSANKAADHLILKYNNASRFTNNGQTFIKNLASKSSFTGISYKIKCGNKVVTSEKWLKIRLAEYHKQSESPK